MLSKIPWTLAVLALFWLGFMDLWRLCKNPPDGEGIANFLMLVAGLVISIFALERIWD